MARFPVFAVADGMGGYAAGEIASAAVTQRLTELAESGEKVSRAAIEDALRAAVEDLGAHEGIDEGTGTTVTGIVFQDEGNDQYWDVMNIGDSRVYREREGVLEQVTVDHSVVQELMSIGVIAPEEAENHPQGNIITRAVGFTEDPTPDFTRLEVEEGTRWVICSDGLTKELTDFGIQHFLGRAMDPAEAASLMVEAAVENGGRDNVTVLVLDLLSADDLERDSPAESAEESGVRD